MLVIHIQINILFNILGHCYDKVRQKTAEMRAMLDKDDAYYYDQTSIDIKEMLQKNRDIKDDDSLSWWNDNLKSKVN